MLTDEQAAALAQLRAVKCKVDPDGCDEGPWCAARARVLKAFESPCAEALAFAAAVIKSGEGWTEKCEEIIGGALAELRGQHEEPDYDPQRSYFAVFDRSQVDSIAGEYESEDARHLDALRRHALMDWNPSHPQVVVGYENARKMAAEKSGEFVWLMEWGLAPISCGHPVCEGEAECQHPNVGSGGA